MLMYFVAVVLVTWRFVLSKRFLSTDMLRFKPFQLQIGSVRTSLLCTSILGLVEYEPSNLQIGGFQPFKDTISTLTSAEQLLRAAGDSDVFWRSRLPCIAPYQSSSIPPSSCRNWGPLPRTHAHLPGAAHSSRKLAVTGKLFSGKLAYLEELVNKLRNTVASLFTKVQRICSLPSFRSPYLAGNINLRSAEEGWYGMLYSLVLNVSSSCINSLFLFF